MIALVSRRQNSQHVTSASERHTFWATTTDKPRAERLDRSIVPTLSVCRASKTTRPHVVPTDILRGTT